MKNLTKLFIAVLACAFFFGACEKEGQFKPGKKIVSIVETDGDYSVQTNYTWDGNKLARVDSKTNSTMYSDSYTEYFTYDKKNRISTVTTDYGETWKYIYEDYKLKRIDIYDGTDYDGSYYFEHNGSKITRIIFTENDKKSAKIGKVNPLNGLLPNNVLENLQKVTNKKGSTVIYLTWDGDNISSVTYDEFYDSFTYDSKKNPLCGLNDPEAIGVSEQILTSKNNMLTNTYNYDFSWGPQSGTLSYSYTYDGKYPVECRCSSGAITRYTYK